MLGLRRVLIIRPKVLNPNPRRMSSGLVGGGLNEINQADLMPVHSFRAQIRVS